MANSSEEQGRAAPKKAASARPSLLGPAAAAPASDRDPVSILSALSADSNAKRPAPARPAPRRRARGLLWLAGLAMIAVLVGYLNTQNEPDPAATRAAAAAPAADTLAVVAASATTPVVPAVAAPQVARIETANGADTSVIEPEPSSATASADSDESSADAAGADASGPVATVEKPPAASSRQNRAAAARSKAKKSEDRLLAALNRSAASKNTSKQRDVELIEALLAHTSPPTLDKGRAAKPAPKAPLPAPKIALTEATPHGVVERKKGESTTELIRKCEQFGVLEGLLCRIRICSDLWGKDPACPAPSVAADATP